MTSLFQVSEPYSQFGFCLAEGSSRHVIVDVHLSESGEGGGGSPGAFVHALESSYVPREEFVPPIDRLNDQCLLNILQGLGAD